MTEQNMPEQASPGKIEIYDDVIKTIAGVAAGKVPGICGMKGGWLKGAKQALTGMKDYAAGVEVNREADGSFTLDLDIIIEDGVKVEVVAVAAQAAVKAKVEEVTGRAVNAVNINIADIKLPEDLMKPQ